MTDQHWPYISDKSWGISLQSNLYGGPLTVPKLFFSVGDKSLFEDDVHVYLGIGKNFRCLWVFDGTSGLVVRFSF